jgi:hypothetical protein
MGTVDTRVTYARSSDFTLIIRETGENQGPDAILYLRMIVRDREQFGHKDETYIGRRQRASKFWKRLRPMLLHIFPEDDPCGV